MLVFVPFCEDVSVTTQGPTLSLTMAADPTVQTMWTSRCRCHVIQHVDEVKIHRPADSTAAETPRNRRSKRKPCYLQLLRVALICRNYEFLDDSRENSVYTSAFRSLGNHLPTTSGFGRGRRDLTLQVSGLRSMVDEIIAELAPECAARQIEWSIGDLPFVECDPGLIKQVLQNLLSNAVKFTRPRSQAVIALGHKNIDGTPTVLVRDNGVGFNMKYADKLFGVFQRLHRTEDFEGTGVGLATVQRIIQKHGGRIWVEAELDKGATFYFTLGASHKSELKSKAAIVGDPT
jgi:hypothetical protein